MTISFKFIWCLLLLVGDRLGIIVADEDSKSDQAPSPIVSVSYGNIRGEFKNDAAVFLGIPYAKPPVKDLQFKVVYHFPKVPIRIADRQLFDRFLCAVSEAAKYKLME